MYCSQIRSGKFIRYQRHYPIHENYCMYAGVRNAEKCGSPLIESLAHHPGTLFRPVRSNSHRSNHDLPPFLHTGQRTCYADDGQDIPCQSSGLDSEFCYGVPWPEPRFAQFSVWAVATVD